MKKLLLWSLLSTLLAASTALAVEPPRVPEKGTEGPDTRLAQASHSSEPVPGIEGPATR